MRTRLPAALAATLALAACGSTVQVSSTSTAGGTGLGPAPGATDATGLGGPSAGGTSGGGTTGVTAPGTATTGSTGTTGTTGTAPARGGSTGSTGATGAPLPAAASTGLGVTAKTISIGVGYSSDGDAANAAIGAGGLTQGDEKATVQALVDEINSRGGIAGRRLVPVFHAYRVTSSDSGATQDQAACQDWTVDHKVIAVLSSSLTDATLVSCLQAKGVVFLKPGKIVDGDQAFLQRFSNEILLATMSQDRIFADQARSFAAQGWYGGWNQVSGSPGTTTKVGVLTYDTDSFTRSLRRVILPALKAAGHAPAEVDVRQVHKPEQESDAAGTAAQVKNALLRFQSDGVTHVVLGDASGFILIFFGSNARTQGYYPRLGVTSGAGVQALFDQGLVTAKQLNGMGGNGWLPTIDVPATDSNRYATSATKRCLDILKRRTGAQFTSSNAATIALSDCDAVFSFQAALARASHLSPAGLLDGFDQLGASYLSPTVGPTFLSAGQHDTAVRAWDLNWVASCSCVRYSREHRVPSA